MVFTCEAWVEVGEWKYITRGKPWGSQAPRNGLRYDCLGLETGKISNLMLDDIQLQLTAMILKFNLSSKAYTLLNIAKSNIETRIRKRKFPKKRKSCYWKDHPTSEKKNFRNVYIPKLYCITILFFLQKKKTGDAFVQSQTQAPRSFMAPYSSHWGLHHPP